MKEIFFDNNIPIYIQLVDYFKNYIIAGKIKPGERISSVRELAIHFKVNPNTMQKALIELESEGLIYTERTNGKFVTENKELIEKIKKELAKQKVNNYLNDMKNIGISNKEAVVMTAFKIFLSFFLTLLNSFLLFPIDYPTTFDTKFTTSKNESFTNSFANVETGLFSIQSNTK